CTLLLLLLAVPAASWAQNGPMLVVSNEGSGDVSLIDLESNRAVATIPVGLRPRGIQVDPGGRRVFVALSDFDPQSEGDQDAIAVVDLGSKQIVARYEAGSDPEQFAVSPDGRWLYSSNEDAGLASITDVRTGELVTQLIV